MHCACIDPGRHLNDVRLLHDHAGVFGFALPLCSWGANLVPKPKNISAPHTHSYKAASRLLYDATQILPQKEQVASHTPINTGRWLLVLLHGA